MSRTVFLDQMNGSDFEEFCKDLFISYYNTNVIRTPLVGDGGKDLIIIIGNDRKYVECKHHPNSTIGRPVVQKLHSAMITDHASSGLIVTTGTFSPEAIRYISDNNLPIELIDHDSLILIASNCGIQLCDSAGQRQLSELCLPPENHVEMDAHLSRYLNDNLISSPSKPSKLHKLMKRDVEMIPFTIIDYRIDASFSTNVGVIHEDRSVGTVVIRETDMQIIDDNKSFLFDRNMLRRYDRNKYQSISKTPANVPYSQIKDDAIAFIQTKRTKTVSYCGKNNQYYSKTCTPSKKDIYITNIQRIYLPYSFIGFSLKGVRRSFCIMENNSDSFYVMNGFDPHRCEHCGKSSDKTMFICNECGKIVSKEHKHAFKCSDCGMTICIGCASYFRKLLLFKKPVCSTCSVNHNSKKYI